MKVVYKNSIGPRAEYRRNSPEAQAGCKAASLRRKEKAVLVDASAAFVFSRVQMKAFNPILTKSRRKVCNISSVLATVVSLGQFVNSSYKPAFIQKYLPTQPQRCIKLKNAQIYPHAHDMTQLSNVTSALRYSGY